MIKNDIQMKRVLARINQLLEEISDLELGPAGPETDFFVSHLQKELESLRAGVRQYDSLRTQPFGVAIDTELREPVLLENVGSLLAKLRIASKLSQAEMAEKLGWHQSNLSRFESDNYSSQTLSKISQYVSALGVWLQVVPSLTERPAELTYRLAAPPVVIKGFFARSDYYVTSIDAAPSLALDSAEFLPLTSESVTPEMFPGWLPRQTLQVNTA